MFNLLGDRESKNFRALCLKLYIIQCCTARLAAPREQKCDSHPIIIQIHKTLLKSTIFCDENSLFFLYRFTVYMHDFDWSVAWHGLIGQWTETIMLVAKFNLWLVTRNRIEADHVRKLKLENKTKSELRIFLILENIQMLEIIQTFNAGRAQLNKKRRCNL